MRIQPDRLATATAIVAIVGSIALSACSSRTGGGPASSKSAAPSTTSTAAPTANAAAQISPGGVTTSVAAPAESTEDEYFKACSAAKVWMDQHGGDPKTQFEPYLANLQKSNASGPGTFGSPWSQLTPGRQSAVIVAAQAAADGLCS